MAATSIGSRRFSCGLVTATPGVLDAFVRNNQNINPFFARHIRGDWGDVCPEDAEANEASLKYGSRLLSVYHLKDGTKFWIITDAVAEDGWRPSTTFLLPEEY